MLANLMKGGAMERDEILHKVLDVVSETLEIDRDALDESSNFKDLGCDSFDLLELVNALEDEFEMTFPDEDLEKIATVGDAVDGLVEAL